jgi:hypothetical protein
MTAKRAQAVRRIMEFASHRLSLEHILSVRQISVKHHLHVGRLLNKSPLLNLPHNLLESTLTYLE